MMTPNILPRVFAVLSVLVTSMLFACVSAATLGPGPATWHSGFTLPELLADPHPARKKEDIRNMLSEPWYGELIVAPVSKPDKDIALSSCTQYFANPIGALEPVREREGTPYMELALMCQAAQEIIASQPAPQSYIPPKFIDENLPRLLPPEVAMVVSVEESKRLLADKNNRSWRDINRIIKATVLDPDRARFTGEQGRQDIELVARGDFNGDGLEDVLFTSRDDVEGGTYSAVRLFQVTRRVPDGRYELIKEYRY